MSACLAVLAAGCGSAPMAGTAARACTGRIVARGPDALAALGQCTTLDGDLILEGGALASLPRLGSLVAITGSLRVGPTAQLAAIDGLDQLAVVSGSVEIATNLAVTGVYLPALGRVGSLRVTGNSAVTSLSAPALAIVERDLVIEGNPDLAWVDLPALRTVGRELVIRDNPSLAELAAASLETVAGAVIIEDNAALPEHSATTLRAAARP